MEKVKPKFIANFRNIIIVMTVLKKSDSPKGYPIFFMAKVNCQTLPFKANPCNIPIPTSLYKFDFHRKIEQIMEVIAIQNPHWTE
jgi:hypothetical protein